MDQVVSKSGRVLTGRAYQLYTGNCPPELPPCTQEMIDRYRRHYDATPDPSNNLLRVPSPKEVDRAKKKYPSLARQAINFGTSLVRHALNGFKVVEKNELDRRMSLCMACEHWQDNRCTKCGCFTAAKTAWERETCPIGRW